MLKRKYDARPPCAYEGTTFCPCWSMAADRPAFVASATAHAGSTSARPQRRLPEEALPSVPKTSTFRRGILSVSDTAVSAPTADRTEFSRL